MLFIKWLPFAIAGFIVSLVISLKRHEDAERFVDRMFGSGYITAWIFIVFISLGLI